MGDAAAGDLEVLPIAGGLGAEIAGVDLARPPSEETVDAIRRVWLEHLVVFFRDQTLAPADFQAFARRLGVPVEYPFVTGIDGYPEIIEVTKLPHETVNFGGIWHSDTVYLEHPPMATLLVAREVPPFGGDTMFANMYAAYDALSPGMQQLLDGLRAVNSSALADVSKTREDRIREHGTGGEQEYVAEHPVVRTHPETGRKALYVNVAHTVRFVGMTEEESRPLLQFLFTHSVRAYCWGAAIADAEGWAFDRQILWTASLLHDFGLTRLGRNTMCFEVEGAEIARGLLERSEERR
jgi:taurine dioxygenase